ncbi:MAG: DUF1667 domain-containing protein [Oscillospiraceae bacterium]|jgi:CxxC motif-containing protein|nr:DUF1667 domain-containing protein [Oscillospiraceae bacterium]
MEKTMVCIVCPAGCALEVWERGGEITVSGNRCRRGEQFAVRELTNPMRTICSTVKTAFDDVPVLPVRVSCDIPKGRIFDVMAEINKVLVRERVGRGDIIIPNVLGLGADVIATSDLLRAAE